MNQNKLTVISSGRQTPLEAARRWAERGCFVIPIPHRQKAPAVVGWQNMRLKVEDLASHFGSSPQNIGLLLGEPYGLTDIDLDCAEALQVWQNFAPPTRCVFGHQSKRFSHFLYYLDPPSQSLKLADPIDKATLLELRCLGSDGVGRQTVVPPSTHRDTGELIRFESGHDGDPSNVDADVIIRAVKKAAAACVLARHYPPAGGGRHDAEMALAGMLARAGWNQDDAKVFAIAVYTAVPSHDRRAIGRVAQAVEDSFRRVAEGEEATGIPKLSALIDKRAVEAAVRWLGIERHDGCESAAWRDHLLLNTRGGIVPCVENALLALRDKAWAGVLAFNESACRVEALSQPPWPSRPVPFQWGDEDDTRATAWLQRQGIIVPQNVAGSAVQTLARDHRYHPVRDHLNSLTWDGTGRIDDWALLYLGAADSAYVRAVASRFLIGAVARVMQPGCKQDTVLILEGPQGCGKSTALRTLAEPWFSDELSDDLGKDAAMQVANAWILELSELDSLSRAETAKVKAFISRSVDQYRPPYGKHLVAQPRSGVLAGTTNSEAYLRDESGARRFWPVRCGKIDIPGLKRVRDQLWAEALVRFKADEPWWLESAQLNALAVEEQDQRFDTDPWHEVVAAWAENRESVSVAEVLTFLDVQKKDWTPMVKGRVGRILRKLGREMRRSGPRSAQERRYYRP